MQKIIAALALSGAAAYVAPVAPKATTALNSKAELEALAMSNTDALGQSMGFWDPLGLADGDFWGLGNEGTIGYLRHAEIKHGRVAMAAFSGYVVQANGFHWPWAMTMDGRSFDVDLAGVETVQDVLDAIKAAAGGIGRPRPTPSS